MSSWIIGGPNPLRLRNTHVWDIEILVRINDVSHALGKLDELLQYGRALYVFPDVVVTPPLEELRQLLDQGPFPRAYLKGKPHNSPIELFGNKITLPSNYFFDASKLLVREPLALARICDGDHAPARLQVGLTTDNLSSSTFYLGEPIISE